MKTCALAILLAGALLAGCGGDGEEKPTQSREETAALARVLVESMKKAFLASLISDTTAVQGKKGAVEIAGDDWRFAGYSPDGELFIDGQLTVEKEKYPNIPAHGQLQLSGSQEGALKVDMVVVVQGLEVSATGTFELNGAQYDVAELIVSGSDSG